MHAQGHMRTAEVSYELRKLTGGVAREAIRVTTSNSRVHYKENEVWAQHLGACPGRREERQT